MALPDRYAQLGILVFFGRFSSGHLSHSPAEKSPGREKVRLEKKSGQREDHQLDWDVVGTVAEIIGALGVVLSLFYLARQIRASSSDTMHASVDRLVEMWSSNIGAHAENHQLAEIWVRSLDDIESLTRTEQASLFAFLSRILRVAEAIHMHHGDGTIDEGLWTGIDASITDMLSTSAMRYYWAHRKHWFGPDFQNYVAARTNSREDIAFYPGDQPEQR